MKKYTAISMAFLFAMFFAVNTGISAMSANSAAEITVMDDHRRAVDAEDLPDAVKETLEGEDYEGYSISEAFHVTSEDGSYYEIKLVKGEETKTVKLNASGEKVEE